MVVVAAAADPRPRDRAGAEEAEALDRARRKTVRRPGLMKKGAENMSPFLIACTYRGSVKDVKDCVESQFV